MLHKGQQEEAIILGLTIKGTEFYFVMLVGRHWPQGELVKEKENMSFGA